MADPGHQSLDLCRKIEAHQFTGTAAQVISEQDDASFEVDRGLHADLSSPLRNVRIKESNFA
jgi:hypothetical protein